MSTFAKSLLIVGCIWSFPALFLFAAVALDRWMRRPAEWPELDEWEAHVASTPGLTDWLAWEKEMSDR